MNLFSKSLKFSGNYLNNPDYAESAKVVIANNNNYNDPVKEGMIRLMAQARTVWTDFGASVFDFFKSYKFKEIIFTLKTISFILTLILLAIIIYVFIKSNSLNKAKTITDNKKSVFKKKKTQKKWIKIEKRFNSGIEANYKLAILEADNFYDECLKILGYESEKNLSNVDEIKKAKKIKNRIVEDSGFMLTTEDTKNSLDAYKKGLTELNVI
ncbi:MAG: hypothetical protein V1686_00680 [Patescibacteria group bacterium]